MPKCGLLNLASCLPELFFEYLQDILNAPIQPLLTLTKNLLLEPINLTLFSHLWAIIIYIISMFYAFLLIYSGFTFIISGYDAAKRENAKSWLRNVVILIILVQASFFIYALAIDLSAILSSTIWNLIDSDFFLITLDKGNIGITLIFTILYLLTLLLTILILILRYAAVAIGVVFFPLGIFFYFIPPLKRYGSLILNFLGIAIFITFFDALVLIGFSRLLEVGFFQSIKIFVMISGFLFIDLMTLFLLFFSIVKAAFSIYVKGGSVVKHLS